MESWLDHFASHRYNPPRGGLSPAENFQKPTNNTTLTRKVTAEANERGIKPWKSFVRRYTVEDVAVMSQLHVGGKVNTRARCV